MTVKYEVFRGSPGLFIDADNTTVRDCVFLDFKGRKKIPIADLIVADGRLIGGKPRG